MLAVRRFAESIRDESSDGSQLQAVLNELVKAIDGLEHSSSEATRRLVRTSDNSR